MCLQAARPLKKEIRERLLRCERLQELAGLHFRITDLMRPSAVEVVRWIVNPAVAGAVDIEAILPVVPSAENMLLGNHELDGISQAPAYGGVQDRHG